ncbi:hypothetical protein L323_17475 [Ruminiclostridium papyrosolvens C7]|uniref:YcxB-like protein domain-containing protein n=1 Tax=Ruminiclostridium papyrosolvens C7 TaxID=1330534 RepID=U4QY51_9FIRM|nr:hypothetical protein L323_17475 [Ruminiclostridium papyrosolvens C7]
METSNIQEIYKVNYNKISKIQQSKNYIVIIFEEDEVNRTIPLRKHNIDNLKDFKNFMMAKL